MTPVREEIDMEKAPVLQGRSAGCGSAPDPLGPIDEGAMTNCTPAKGATRMTLADMVLQNGSDAEVVVDQITGENPEELRIDGVALMDVHHTTLMGVRHGVPPTVLTPDEAALWKARRSLPATIAPHTDANVVLTVRLESKLATLGPLLVSYHQGSHDFTRRIPITWTFPAKCS